MLALADVVGLWTGLVTAEEADGALEAALISGVMLALGGFRLRWLTVRHKLDRPPVPKPDSRPEIPPAHRYQLFRKNSAVREPMRQLDEAEATLAQMLRRLEDSHRSAVPPGSVEDAWRIARDAATELRGIAGNIEAVELAVRHALPPERAELEEGLRGLRERLTRGFDAYRSLIAAAGRVLIASASAPAGEELGEATEHLAGLAQALHELSGDYDR